MAKRPDVESSWSDLEGYIPAQTVASLLALPALQSVARRPPAIRVEHHADIHRFRGETTIVRVARRRQYAVVLHVWPGQTQEERDVTLLHELVHCAQGCWSHYGSFKRTLMKAAFEAWSIDVRSEFHNRRRTADIDNALIQALAWKRGWRSWLHWCAGRALRWAA